MTMYRQKQVEVTDDILAQIEKISGATMDVDNIVVFEAAAASTRPMSKAGSIFDGARMSREMLREMADTLNAGEESVPLHTLHAQGYEIPKGRVFRGHVHDEPDGSATLRTMFYLPLSEKELIEKINLGILDEVSVGVKAKQALCSKCGFDYFGEDADFGHLFSQTCENDHTLGEDGTHLKLSGSDKWMELSLVSRGASDKPKILSRPKQLLSKDEHDRIAADGKPVEATFLFTSMTTETPEMSKNDPNTQEFDAKKALAELEEQLPQLIEQAVTTALEAADTSNDDLEAAKAELETAKAELEATKAELETTKAELEAAQDDTNDPLADPNLPPGGVSASAVTDAQHLKANTQGRAAAFKTKR